MAKYVSALTGPEMDAALMDMAQHNSEAWAVGERNGEAVSSADITYHNNARYYSDNAMSAAARAEAAVPAGTAGALFFDQAQTLTDANKRQVYSNLSINPAPAPNMLDNAWFLVNQRGDASYSTTGRFVFDRWYLYSGEVSWSANGISTASACVLYQSYDRVRFTNGAYYRCSVLLSDGTIYSARMAVDGSYHYIPSSGANRPFRMRFETSGMSVRFQILADGAGLVVRAVKVEKTYYSTLDLDVMPDVADEIAKCYRFLYIINSRSSSSYICDVYYRTSDAWRAIIPLPAVMVNTPSVSISTGNASDLSVQTGNANYAATSFSSQLLTGNYTLVYNVKTTAPSTIGAGALMIGNSATLIISAEI